MTDQKRDEAIERGAQLFRTGGEVRDYWNWTEAQWNGPLSVHQRECLGWIIERGRKLMAECKEQARTCT